ncbi:MAG: glycosyltransferase family 4 protein [Bacteroidaceae bacterium]|nr:glycosyltransferase family 4 protein [Bacteroidaceae bacterium]
MRILYVIEHLSVKGGLERILTSKINALSERGHEVVLLTVWKEDKATAFPIDGRVKHYCLDINRPGSMFAYPLTLVRVLRRFNNIMKTIQPDVTILFRAMGAWIAGWTSWKGRMIFESHGARWSNNHIWLYPRMEQRVESVVCLTKGDAQEYKKARRVAVIPNFTEIVPAGEPDYTARRVIFVGRRCPEKNIERLENLWSRIQQTHPEWKLDCHHDTEDIASAYRQASIQVMTSRSEGFPMSLIEGQKCGLPCVVFDCKYGPAEIIVDGQTGYLIPYSDDEAFIERLTRLMDDESLRRRMGKEAMRLSHRFDKNKIIDEWEHFLS